MAVSFPYLHSSPVIGMGPRESPCLAGPLGVTTTLTCCGIAPRDPARILPGHDSRARDRPLWRSSHAQQQLDGQLVEPVIRSPLRGQRMAVERLRLQALGG